MAVSTEEAWSVPGTAVQPPPQAGRPDPMSEFTRDGELQKPVIEAQGDMMREFWEKWNVPVSPEVKKAYGVEDGDASTQTSQGAKDRANRYVARPLIH